MTNWPRATGISVVDRGLGLQTCPQRLVEQEARGGGDHQSEQENRCKPFIH